MRLDANEAQGTASVTAELEPRAWALCPLPEQGGLRAMNATFIGAVEAAGTLLSRNTTLLEAMLAEQATVDELRRL